MQANDIELQEFRAWLSQYGWGQQRLHLAALANRSDEELQATLDVAREWIWRQLKSEPSRFSDAMVERAAMALAGLSLTGRPAEGPEIFDHVGTSGQARLLVAARQILEVAFLGSEIPDEL